MASAAAEASMAAEPGITAAAHGSWEPATRSMLGTRKETEEASNSHFSALTKREFSWVCLMYSSMAPRLGSNREYRCPLGEAAPGAGQ